MPELKIENLIVRYGLATAVTDVDIEVRAGSITGLVGPNGAGKSSFLQAIYGSTKSTGRILWRGSDLSGVPAVKRARMGVALVPQGRQLFPHLTVKENLRVMAELLRLPNSSVDEAIGRFPILGARAKKMAGVLSGGEQQMLVVSRALMGAPKILLLDEMMTGLAPVIVQSLLETIDNLARDGVAVLYAAPEIGAVYQSIDRGYVIIRGSIRASEEGGGKALNAAYVEAVGIDTAMQPSPSRISIGTFNNLNNKEE